MEDLADCPGLGGRERAFERVLEEEVVESAMVT